MRSLVSKNRRSSLDKPTDLSANSSIETVTSAAISKIIFTGPWTFYRGGNLVWRTFDTSQTHDFAALGTSLGQYPGATIVCNTASASASLMIQISKGSPVAAPAP